MSDKSTKTALVAAVVALVLGAAGAARAERIYRYVDDDGVTVITNVPPGSTRSRGLRMKEKEGLVRVTAAPQPSFKARSLPPEYAAWIDEACALYRIPVALARAIMAAESNFNPDAVSHAGAQGLMQLMPQTAAEMFVEDPFDPKQNIFGGVRYLRVLANEFNGEMIKMIAGYNAGPNAVKRAGGVPNIPETQEYVRRVLRLYYSYKNEGAGR
ncbi:MAG: transglycosylase SLT domain-containing protein [Myxococcales bacterium]|jgi:soluble lytic murein transglycosylase-like protein